MITINDAYEIATSEVSIPADAILTYSNLLSGRYVFEWKHQSEYSYSETDRILIWIDPVTGEVFKKDVKWSTLKQPDISLLNTHISAIHNITIIEYRKIAKKAYFTYSGEPLSDYYWIGEDEYTRYLIDNYGNIVGEMIPKPTNNGYSASGYIQKDKDVCWNVSFYTNYFEEWCDGDVYESCGPSKDSFVNTLSDESTVFYQITAHGSFSISLLNHDIAIRPADIDSALESRSPMPFAHLDHCDAMDRVGDGTFEYAYRKGSDTNAVVIGLAHTTDESWVLYLNYWRDCFYNDLDDDKDTSIKTIYDDCVASYPDMDGHLGFTGDETLTINKIITMYYPLCDFTVSEI